MEFSEKLQYLRKQHHLTQEQLAEKLYVSRTAISKWESGKGYPNIESLKCISRVLDVSIDDLLSNEELLIAAEEDHQHILRKASASMTGLLDIFSLACIFLPLYGNPAADSIRSVNLLAFTAASPIIRAAYWLMLILLILTGLAQLLLARFSREAWRLPMEKCSLILSVLAILLFVLTREPYVVTLLFLFFLAKLFLLIFPRKTA